MKRLILILALAGIGLLSMPYVSAQEVKAVKLRIISCNDVKKDSGEVVKICVVEIKYRTTVTM